MDSLPDVMTGLTIPIPQRNTVFLSSEDDLSPLSIIEPDSDPGDDVYDMDSCAASTKSATPSIFNYVREYGRTYHGYKPHGLYMFPNDNCEVKRLHLQYCILQTLFKGHNYFAPLKNPRRILDIGTGTGIWAIEMARAFPRARVFGTDLSPIQPDEVPINLQLLIDDANEEKWGFEADEPGEKPMDYIHTRVLLGCFNDFREIIRKSYANLKPGGWMESQEYFSTVYCDDDSMKPDYAFAEWTRTWDKAAMALGKPLRIANKLKRWYEQAGFVDVHEEVFKLPINTWPKDPYFKMLGKYSTWNLQDGLQAMSLAMFREGLHWTKDEIEVYLAEVRKSIADRNVHAYHKIYVVWGRKPFEHEIGNPSAPAYPPPPPPLDPAVITPWEQTAPRSRPAAHD